MQVSHVHTAATTAATHHPEIDPAVAVGQAAGQVIAPIVLYGWPLLAVFVVYRFFRWLFRTAR